MSRSKSFQAIFLAYTSLLLLGLCDNIRGPLYPEILKDFVVSNTEGSLFFALASLAGFFGGLLSQRIEGRIGPLNTLRASVFAMMFSQLMMSFSPNFILLVLGSILFGTSLGVMGVVQNVMVMHALPAGPLKNRVMAGLHSTYAGASLLAPLIVNATAVLNFPYSIWRVCFVITALIGLLILSLTFQGPAISNKKDEPDQNGRVSKSETAAQIYFGVVLSSYVLCEILVSSRMALYMRTQFHATLSQSSWYTAGFFVCLLLGRILFTVWSPPISLKKQLMGSLFFGMLFLLVGISYHPLSLVLAGLCMGPFYPMAIVAAGHLFPRTVNSALSWAIALASLFVVLMHFGVGYVTDVWGLPVAFYFGPGFCALALGMLILYEKIFRRLQHSF